MDGKPTAKQHAELLRAFNQSKDLMKQWKKMAARAQEEDGGDKRQLKDALRNVDKYTFIVELPEKAIEVDDLLETWKEHSILRHEGSYLVKCLIVDRNKAWHPVLSDIGFRPINGLRFMEEVLVKIVPNDDGLGQYDADPYGPSINQETEQHN